MSDDETIEPTSAHQFPHSSSSNNDPSHNAIVSSGKNPNQLTEELLDNLMDISMEIASNKRMKKDHIKPFRLTFKDKELEAKV